MGRIPRKRLGLRQSEGAVCWGTDPPSAIAATAARLCAEGGLTPAHERQVEAQLEEGLKTYRGYWRGLTTECLRVVEVRSPA